MTKSAFLVLVTVFSASSAAMADVDLAKMIGGEYTVVNRTHDCLEKGNPYGTSVSISVQGHAVTVQSHGSKSFTIEMTEGKKDTTLADGSVMHKSGTAFGNGFGYGEEVRNGRLILSKVEYMMHWEDGALHLKRTTRVNARHSEAAYCDLSPLSSR